MTILFCRGRNCARYRSHPLEQQCDTLADADAHGAQRITATRFLQLVDRGRHQARTTGAKRMAKRDCATVRVDTRIVVLQAQVAQYGKALGSEGFVHLDQVKLIQVEPGQGQQFSRGRCGPVPWMGG